MDREKLIQSLYQHQNKENQQQMSAYMRDQFAFLGIKSPLRRKLVQAFFAEEKKRMKDNAKKWKELKDEAESQAVNERQMIDWDFIFLCWNKEEREFQYVATDYLSAFKNYLLEEDMHHLERLIVEKSWWDTVDALAKTIGFVVKKYGLEDLILMWSQDENLWLRRVAIIHQLQMKEATNKALLEEIIEQNLGSQEFFINKAIGWALRDYSKTNPEFVRSFIANKQNNLSALSIREASKYI